MNLQRGGQIKIVSSILIHFKRRCRVKLSGSNNMRRYARKLRRVRSCTVTGNVRCVWLPPKPPTKSRVEHAKCTTTFPC